ncbi:hypothetical protein DWB85_00915 [Seongchinamella sediminis]|uniref:Uncharacterized protein n=1 Tax=Seongchinamella sediminis TaxID=2283635 RepID=A0A3L7E2H3_9GAMM|nr:hypothetical protein [Seongchinamella sediminis]RLQ23746.1 hypothetical protein DWB85_00915 [Seongchinamella sediminis]
MPEFKRARETPAVILSVAAALLLGALAAWIYAPGIHGPYLLDDFSSLGHLDNLVDTPTWSLDYVFGDTSGMLGRTVSMATFVLDTLVSGGAAEAAKQVNIYLHLLTGLLLWGFLALLLSFVPVRFPVTAALAFTAVWLLAPLQVSTVLYLVQRMAMLAALFCLASLVSYLLWRRSQLHGRPQVLYLLFVPVFGALAALSKENGLLFIPLVLLLEAFWLQFADGRGGIDRRLRTITLGLIGLGCVAISVLLLWQWQWLQAAHGLREFSLEERLLTQLRILWDYVGQFYLPDIARLGLFHDDYPVSTSLAEPGTTGPALLAWALVLVACLAAWLHPWARRIAFGALFFMAGHSLESTVWPLELYFEHRNYLPSVGLVILPMAIYLAAVEKWPETGRPLLAWVWVFVFWLALQTSSQVQIWSSAPLLAMQQVNGHPESSRANKEYASQLATAGAREAALKYSRLGYESALKHPAAADEHFGDYKLRDVAIACIARQPLRPDEYQQLGSVNPSRPLGQVSTLSVVIKLRQGDACPAFDWDGFLDHLAGLYLHEYDTSLASAQMFSALAMLANAQQRWQDAYQYTARFLDLAPDNIRGMLMQLHFTTALNRRDEADALIARLQKLQDAGKLKRSEQDTLALYLEN